MARAVHIVMGAIDSVPPGSHGAVVVKPIPGAVPEPAMLAHSPIVSRTLASIVAPHSTIQKPTGNHGALSIKPIGPAIDDTRGICYPRAIVGGVMPSLTI